MDNKKYNLYLLIKENDVFNLCFIDINKIDETIKIYELWFDKINISINLEKINIIVSNSDKNEIEKLFINNISIININNELNKDKITNKQHFINIINNILEYNKIKLNIIGNIFKFSSREKILLFQNNKPINNKPINKSLNYKPVNYTINTADNIDKNGLLINDNIKPYNSSKLPIDVSSKPYNIGKSPFNNIIYPYDIDGNNYNNIELLNDNIDIEDKIYIIFNKYYLSSLILNNIGTFELELLKNNNFEFEIYYESNKILNNNIQNIVDKMFNGETFESKDIFINQIEIFKKLLNNINSSYNSKEKDLILNYINNNYTITKNIDDKIKSSDLFAILNYNTIPKNIDDKIMSSDLFAILNNNINIQEKNKTNIISFRNRSSKYLIEIGLTKKRFTDGYYYYGLKKKNYSNDNIQEMFDERAKLYS